MEQIKCAKKEKTTEDERQKDIYLHFERYNEWFHHSLLVIYGIFCKFCSTLGSHSFHTIYESNDNISQIKYFANFHRK